MPRIFGHNSLFVLAAFIVMYLIGFAWYGIIFEEPYQALSGMDMETPTAPWRMYGVGLAIPLLSVLGLSWAFNKFNQVGMMRCVKSALAIAVFFAVSTNLYALAYDVGYPLALMWIDGGHILVGYGVAGAIISFGK
ncbi:DUF1761 domain-containing protein [Hyphobacterium sp. HN65]|uniref:DUF1761 domain-containing protein n=1 Tax=Hyphobacterium lacteum TaxID=3116575 RepID=A0ABU7LTF4_9PROT|nr:DUF1761 domain-containing protein [Hyphobacterium sp. HN65]MEE2527201.1 DUF1761 domain-containing protein [Hyphobacterium sp. HN65]